VLMTWAARPGSNSARRYVGAVPRVVLQEATGELLGVPFYVMEKVAGHVIRDQMPEGYAETPGEKLALADALIDALAELHEVEPKAIGLGDYGRRMAIWRGRSGAGTASGEDQDP